MFLVVLSVTFVFAKLITKPSEFERFGDSADTMDPEDYEDPNPLTDNKEIYALLAAGSQKNPFTLQYIVTTSLDAY